MGRAGIKEFGSKSAGSLSARLDSNQEPIAYKATALPLRQRWYQDNLINISVSSKFSKSSANFEELQVHDRAEPLNRSGEDGAASKEGEALHGL